MARYNRIKSIDSAYWIDGCPIVLTKGALLSDSRENKNLLQLQFRNVGQKEIAALTLLIAEEDILGKNLLAQTTGKYLDLTARPDELFGDRQPLYLQSGESRNFDFIVGQVIFADRTVWTSDKMLQLLPPPEPDSLGGLSQQFLRELTQKTAVRICQNLPTELKGGWYCACGGFNHDANPACCRCGTGKDLLFSLLDPDLLEKDQALYERQEKERWERAERERQKREAEEAERERVRQEKLREMQEKEQAAARQKKKKQRIAALVAAVCLVLVCVGYKFFSLRA